MYTAVHSGWFHLYSDRVDYTRAQGEQWFLPVIKGDHCAECGRFHDGHHCHA